MDRFSVDLISWPGTNPQAGTDGALAVILDIEDHWHLQAGAGTPEAKPDAIPTELEITAPEGCGPSASRYGQQRLTSKLVKVCLRRSQWV